MLTESLINDACAFLASRVRRTPVEFSSELSSIAGAPVWLKLECLQETGSFKLRGAWFCLSQLSSEQRARGVVTCSAGNHGVGLAYAARELGVKATVFVPRDTDSARLSRIEALGARAIRTTFPGYDASETFARAEADQLGQHFISPFDDDHIMAGSGGSVAREVLEQVPDARTFILPVGGGGLSAGFAFTVHSALDAAHVIAAQHEQAPGLALSLEQGEAVTELPPLETAACGLEGGIGVKTFRELRSRVQRVELLSEEEILDATRWIAEKHGVLVEPTAAVSAAAALFRKQETTNSPMVVVLSGRNIDPPRLKSLWT